jgi:toxin-antitoxin system PIN domain toxin
VSFSVDVNLLVYASDLGSPFHPAARSWLEERAGGREIFCIAWTVAMSYLRIVTHPGILARPLAPQEALENLRALESQSNVRFIAEREGFLDAYAEVTAGEPLRGKLVPDAHLAAVLLQHDVRTLFSADNDFRRFVSLDVRNPLTG